MGKKEQYEELVRRYLENKASDEELDVFFDLMKKGKLDPYLQEALQKEEEIALKRQDGQAVVIPWRKWTRFAGAAAVIGLLAVGGFWYWTKMPKKIKAGPGIQYSGDIRPGRNHALLTMADGKIIDLDSNSASVMTLQANTRLVKNVSGEWVYHSNGANNTDATIYNTISAPRGGQFPFVLEDGTKVWLNAASSLRFPTTFHGKSRPVTLEGEAYFEVAPNSRMPFLVQTGSMQVRVLGTHFNVNAYTDESAIRTTLLEGSVKIIKDETAALLQPGEQASLEQDGTVNTVKDPEVVEAAMAWRNGYFSFDEDNIQTVMRQISRWYNVDVHYEGPVTKAAFGGDIGRDLSLVQVLRVLEKSQVHFRLEGNSLTVLP